ncbi:hypothetical protein [Bacillus mesophilum]|uniref:Uncharacterized protein n=1 Tax=Bacillus mesophilum TaxID=1071718 RepID=A0A7V7UTB6_9BACI|nr:hypothetical protein [Bacillus mesophilum]KAB2330070.1 hypothetical protein F7732_20010 [Bacillus mesophilum]
MPNFVPYLILTVISVAILAKTIVQQRQFGYFVLFLSYSGMVYIAELFVMVLGNCYVYKPEVLSIAYYDHILGAIVSNLFVIPALGAAAAVYHLKVRWLFIFAVTLVGVEILFEWLGIYYANWWRKEYTFIAVFFFFILSRVWLWILQTGKRWVQFLSLWMQGWAGAATVMYTMSVIGIRYYQYGFFDNPYRDDIFISALLALLKGLIFAVGVFFIRKLRYRLLTPLFVFGADMPLYVSGVLVIEIQFWLYSIIYLMLGLLLLWWNHYACNVFRRMRQSL